MSAFVFGASAAVAKLRGRAVVGGAGVVLAAVSGLAWASRHFELEDAVDHVLGSVAFGVVLPLVAYAAVGRVSGEQKLEEATRAIWRHGGDRRAAVIGMVLATALRVAVFGAALSSLTVLFARGRLDGASLLDGFTSAWIGALGGAAYAVWYSAGALFGRGGRGRAFALAIDWVLGATASAIAFPWPRAHLRSLLGGEPVLGLPSWQSTVVLYGLSALYLVVIALRVER